MKNTPEGHKDGELAETRIVQDDLLQAFQGLMLTVHVASQNMELDHAARKLLDHALARADQVILDARHRIERIDAGRSGYSESQ